MFIYHLASSKDHPKHFILYITSLATFFHQLSAFSGMLPQIQTSAILQSHLLYVTYFFLHTHDLFPQ